MKEMQAGLAEAIFQATAEAIMVTDADNKVVAVNPAFEHVTGYSAQEMMGCKPSVLSSGRHDRSFYITLWHTLLATGHWRGEVWNRRKSGELYAQRLTISLVRDVNGRVVNHVAVFSDITDFVHETDRLRHSASYDLLTGLPNRALLLDRLRQALAKAARDKGRVGVLFLDLDGFKAVNDTFGHSLGDQLLVTVAERLRRCVRESDTVARLGGDEFVVLVPTIADDNDTQRIATKIIESVAEPFVLNGKTAQIGTSIGIAAYPTDAMTAEKLLEAADETMYRAKAAGGSRYSTVASDWPDDGKRENDHDGG